MSMHPNSFAWFFQRTTGVAGVGSALAALAAEAAAAAAEAEGGNGRTERLHQKARSKANFTKGYPPGN